VAAEDTPRLKIQFKREKLSAASLKECPGEKVQLKVSEKFARLYDKKTGKPIGEKLKPRHVFDQSDRLKITCWSFSPDGKLVAIGGGYVTHFRSGDNNIGDIRVWDTATGKLVAQGPKGIGQICQLAFTKDGKTIQFVAEEFDIDGP
jgi:WD40 repeat protein